MIRNGKKVNQKNLRQLCWQSGFHGVSGLANHIDRSRITVHRAVRWPDQFGPTYQLIQEALNVK
jgi:hypothetical protein